MSSAKVEGMGHSLEDRDLTTAGGIICVKSAIELGAAEVCLKKVKGPVSGVAPGHGSKSGTVSICS